MTSYEINLKVLKMEYNIPVIGFDPPISQVTSNHFQETTREKSIRKMSINTSRPAPNVDLHKCPPPGPQRLVEQLLAEIYGCRAASTAPDSEPHTSASELPRARRQAELRRMSIPELSITVRMFEERALRLGGLLAKRLYNKDALKRRQRRLCFFITAHLKKIEPISGDEGDMRFSVSPRGGASGWAEWLRAMRLVARLPAGIPPDFRRKLWLTLAEQHLKVKGVDWTKAEKNCFSEWTNPDDTELGVQIVKDLHRTGCSLFCGSEGRENQAVLKRVLLAYARWNKGVGYCQGFNMLAALILEVMDRSESDSLKVMIYLIEAVLPEGYFANNLRGLSVDMAVFRDLLHLRLPRLSNHLDKLQKGTGDGSCFEPPLTNVFTMQWFLTLFCNCLPRATVLRVWDLTFLEGDEILLTTALAIWDTLQERILRVDSADEFYSVMGELARETLEASPARSEELLVRAAKLGPVPELQRLRDKHRYNITPWAHSVQSAAKKGLRLFYSEDETDSSDEGDKLAITAAYGFQSGGRGRGALVAAGVFGHPDRERLALDISALKQQYARLRERQRQAHIILAAACARQPHVGSSSSSGPISMNHLLLGKNAIVSARGRRLGPPQGAVPPVRTPKTPKSSTKTTTPSKNETLHWKDENTRKSISRRDSIKWKDVKQVQSEEGEDTEEVDEEDGKQVSETEINEILQTSMRSRRKSESSSYSECSESSSSTSLCDEPNRMSDFDSEPASLSENVTCLVDNPVNDIKEEVDKTGLDENEASIIPSVTEFGSYVQEFEELLDRTNNIENERGLVCVLPEENDIIIKTESDDVELLEDKHYTTEEEIFPDNTDYKDEQNYTTEEEEIINNVDEAIEVKNNYTTEDEEAVNNVEETLDIKNDYTTEEDEKPNEEDIFEEFVDSNRGEPLRNYLEEFRKADFSLKQEWESTEMLHEEIEEPKSESQPALTDTDHYQELSITESETDRNDDLKKPTDISEDNVIKPFTLNDFRSSSCDRSLSSSISSVSPILKPTPGFIEDRISFLSYKSPCRIDSDAASEMSEDEKPLVLTIDKYFEHSPEFFGARKCGSYLSSDEEDDRFIGRAKKVSIPYNSKKSEFLSFNLPDINKTKTVPNQYKTDVEEPSYEKQDNSLDLEIDDDVCCAVRIKKKVEIVSSPEELKYVFKDTKVSSVASVEPKSIFPTESPTSANKHLLFNLKTPTDTYNFADSIKDKEASEKSSEHVRLNILEKTKSEELPTELKRSFSILDEEIEAIRQQSGRRNSERALKIIQENSKILHRILINQVNKTSFNNSFQEEGSLEVINEQTCDKIVFSRDNRIRKCLASPRSSSLDDNITRKIDTFIAKPPTDFTLELKKRHKIDNNLPSPSTTLYKETEKDDTAFTSHPRKDYYMVSPIPYHNSNETALSLKQTKPHSPQNLAEGSSDTQENKTDMFGWENKGFTVNQRISSDIYKDEMSPSKPLRQSLISDYIESKTLNYNSLKEKSLDQDKGPSRIDSEVESEFNHEKNTEVKLNLKPFDNNKTESPDKDSTLTAISEPLGELLEYSTQDFNESWRVENNNSVSDSFNLSSPYKFTYKSSDVSGYIDNSFKNVRKFSDSPLSKVTDTFPRLGESSPLDNLSKLEGLKHETSQSSDMCVVSSSMSFSFDPSVDEQPSSKPGTFNSSDTLCQLTSLDQVSTPISPKATTYSMGKDSTGISQRDLSLELDRFRLTSEEMSCTHGGISDSDSVCISSLKTPTSPTASHDRGQPFRSPDKLYSPFPSRTSSRPPRELGLRLGLYRDPQKSPSK